MKGATGSCRWGLHSVQLIHQLIDLPVGRVDLALRAVFSCSVVVIAIPFISFNESENFGRAGDAGQQVCSCRKEYYNCKK